MKGKVCGDHQYVFSLPSLNLTNFPAVCYPPSSSSRNLPNVLLFLSSLSRSHPRRFFITPLSKNSSLPCRMMKNLRSNGGLRLPTTSSYALHDLAMDRILGAELPLEATLVACVPELVIRRTCLCTTLDVALPITLSEISLRILYNNLWDMPTMVRPSGNSTRALYRKSTSMVFFSRKGRRESKPQRS